MWMYALGFFLVEIGCGSLLLPAVSGLGIAVSVVLFGSMVGDWVDTNPRLKGLLFLDIASLSVGRFIFL